MLNHRALAVLADMYAMPATRAQQALRIFAEYDLSVPRRLLPGLLDQEYDWQAGTAASMLAKLVDEGLLRRIGKDLYMLAPEYTWTPASLAEQWRAMEQAQDRVAALA